MNTLKFTLLDSFAIPLSCGYNCAIAISPACAFNQITGFTLFLTVYLLLMRGWFTYFFFFFSQSVSINEFLKPAEGERYYGGRGRGRGRGDRGGFRGGYVGGYRAPPAAPAIQDQSQFPSLGGKWKHIWYLKTHIIFAVSKSGSVSQITAPLLKC